jgi:hypothetical protein
MRDELRHVYPVLRQAKISGKSFCPYEAKVRKERADHEHRRAAMIEKIVPAFLCSYYSFQPPLVWHYFYFGLHGQIKHE